MIRLVGFYYLATLLILTSSENIQEEWNPLPGGIKTYQQTNFDISPQYSLHREEDDQCSLYKVGFTQDLYFQYIQYKTKIPEMKEFTLCFWSKFSKHSNDHPIFSYAVDGQPKAIYSWIANTERSSYFSLSVEGHTFFRLNYPIRLNRWYHTCQSWNGKTGEWQIWVNAERVGRGFYNRLVGHVIPADGVAITGQEQTQLGGGFLEGKGSPQGSGGMLGEITMLQLYNVALTAGKAHHNHKHHHAHQYDHFGNQITTPAPTTPPPRPTLPSHPLLTGGQINPALMLNIAGGQPEQQTPQLIPGQNYNAQYLNGQFVNNLVSQQLTVGQGTAPYQLNSQPLLNSGLVHPSLVNPANVQFIDVPLDSHQIYKRQNGKSRKEKRSNERDNTTGGDESKKNKRELIIGSDGHIIDSSIINAGYDENLLGGLADIGENEPILEQQRKQEEKEPAEAEVRAVMNICSGCEEEPFDKALVFGWRNVPKKLYSGAFYTPAVTQCKVF